MAQSCGTVTVEPAFDDSLVTLGSCSIGSPTVTEGGSITATSTVTNDNDRTAIVDLELTVDGSVEATQTVDVASNSTLNAEFSVSFSGPGDYDVSVNITNVSMGGGR